MPGEIITYLPEAAAAVAGFAAGIPIDRWAAHKSEDGQRAALHTYGANRGELESRLKGEDPTTAVPVAVPQRTLKNQLRDTFSNPAIPLLAATVLGVTVDAWTEQRAHHPANLAAEVVADVNSNVAHDGARPKINSLVDQFNHQGSVKVRVIAAKNGTGAPVAINNFKDVIPFSAPTSVKTAVETAMTNAQGYSATNHDNNTQNDVTPAIVAITDGSPIGNARTIIKEIKNGKNDVPPVFVADMAPGNSYASQLKTLAKDTHGKYWAVAKSNPDVVSAIRDKVKVQATETAPTGDKLPEKFFSGLILLGLLAAVKSRADIRFRGKKINQGSKEK